MIVYRMSENLKSGKTDKNFCEEYDFLLIATRADDLTIIGVKPNSLPKYSNMQAITGKDRFIHINGRITS